MSSSFRYFNLLSSRTSGHHKGVLALGSTVFLLCSIGSTTAELGAALGADSTVQPQESKQQQQSIFSEDEEAKLDKFLLKMDDHFEKLNSIRRTSEKDSVYSLGNPDPVITPAFPDDGFPTSPTDQPIDYGGDGYFPFPTFQRRNGAAEGVAMVALYETLNFYGVVHVLEKKGTRIEFTVLKSKNNYFNNLTKLDVAFAIREFARYLTAMLCGQGTMDNYYQVISQVPPEELGVRFKYDMAWALMGNTLPKEPNEIFKAGARWSALQQVLSSGSVSKDGTGTQSKELHSWLSSVGDIMGALQRLNKLMCYVDVRPDPKEELKKRVVVTKFLDMDRKLTENYNQLKPYVDEALKQQRASQISTLRQPTTNNFAPTNALPDPK